MNTSVMKYTLAFILILAASLSRMLPHPLNFTPLAAIALFGGVYFDKKFAIIVPLAAMLISDYFIGFYGSMYWVYGSFVIIGIIGMMVKNRKTLATIFAGTLSSSVLFFVITNFGAWLSPLYPHTLAGLQSCYINAIPFYRTTLTSTVVFSMLLYVSYEYLLARRDNPVLAKLLA